MAAMRARHGNDSVTGMIVVKVASKILFVSALAAAPVFAQWPGYPTAGVPKTPDGKADLNGPTPRTADGKPDFSGVWQYVRGPQPPVNAANSREVNTSDITPLAIRLSQFWNLGAA